MNFTHNLIVQKYGGKSLSTPALVQQVASRIAHLHQQNQTLIIVVSAMGQATDELLRLAYQMSPHPNRRELDMLLTAGERISMALMSMALNDLGCASISLTGSQAGVLTDSAHSNARIVELKPMRVEENLRKGKVVVLAGFQGVDPQNKEVTTLGRGGSDTTAVAMAAHFSAQRCEILKDVDGLYSADPKLVENAIHYSHFPLKALRESCYWGAKVLHYRSVELAINKKVPLYIGSSQSPSQGTLILDSNIEENMYEEVKALTVNSLDNIQILTMKCSHTQEGFMELEKALSAFQLGWPQILFSSYRQDEWQILITYPEEQSTDLKQALSASLIQIEPQILTAVTLTCNGHYMTHLNQKVLLHLKTENIYPLYTLHLSPNLIFIINPEQKIKAIRALHQFINSSLRP